MILVGGELVIQAAAYHDKCQLDAPSFNEED